MRNEELFKEKPVWSAILTLAIPSVLCAKKHKRNPNGQHAEVHCGMAHHFRRGAEHM